MPNEQILLSIAQTIFPIFFWGILLLIFFVVKFFTDDIFTINFKEAYEKMPEENENFSVRFSGVCLDSKPPENFFDLFNPLGFVQFKGFYVRFYMYQDSILVKFFGKAYVITNSNRISLSNKFLSRMYVGVSDKKSMVFALSPRQFDRIKQWIERQQQKNIQ